MSLTFGVNDLVNCGSGASIDNLMPFTALMWVYPTALTANTRFFVKRDPAAASGKMIRIGSGSDQAEATVWDTSGGSALFARTNTGFVTLNTWQMFAMVMNTTGPVYKIYRGTLTAAAAEATYISQTASGVAVSDDSSRTLYIGNEAGGVRGFPGRIAVFAYVARQMSAAEIIDWQFAPRVVADTKLFTHLGYGGTTSYDWSGFLNHGTVTGATIGNHVPLRSAFGFDDGNANISALANRQILVGHRASLAGPGGLAA